jgi:hypothetical protein
VLTEIGPVQAQTPTPAGRDRRDRAVAHRSRSGRRVRWPHFEEVYGAKVSRDVVIDMLTGGPVDPAARPRIRDPRGLAPGKGRDARCRRGSGSVRPATGEVASALTQKGDEEVARVPADGNLATG